MSALPRTAEAFKHGEHIFVYCNLRTDQIIYSLSRSMKNNPSLKQIPQLGKKSKPSGLRKDLWRPFAHLRFPHPQLGLQVYHKLREFRKLHETSYPTSSVLADSDKHGAESSTPFVPKHEFRSKLSHKLMPPIEAKTMALSIVEDDIPPSDTGIPSSSIREENSFASNNTDAPVLDPVYTQHPPPLLPKKKRIRTLMSQKPNSVADIAAALLIASRPTPSHILARRERMELPRGSPKNQLAKRGPGSKCAPTPGERWEDGVQGVTIGWADIRDTEYAEKWPTEVAHEDGLESNRYTVNWPKAQGDPKGFWRGRFDREEMVEERKEEREGKKVVGRDKVKEAAGNGEVEKVKMTA